MSDKTDLVKEPISKASIFKVMLYVAFGVSGIFFVKNVLVRDITGMLVIAAMIAIFAASLLLMKVFHAKQETRQFVVSMSLLGLVFVISLFSGQYYSDDFPLYLAVIGLTGLYLRPRYTKIQVIVVAVLLVLQYLLHPEKADSLTQFILCIVMTCLAGTMFYLAINRGRAFIKRSELRAEEAERLLESLKTIGGELQKNVEASGQRFGTLKETNAQMAENAGELQKGSDEILHGAREIEGACDNVQERMLGTQKQIATLNEEVKSFEAVLGENRKNMEDMARQISSVQTTMEEAGGVFQLMEKQVEEITAVTDKLNSISSGTTMLALNASIEAARAGQLGAGFAVVASKVRDLADDSNKCSEEVSGVVDLMQEQIGNMTKRLEDSVEAVQLSITTLQGLQDGFDQLTEQFHSLYGNIEMQNSNVNQVDEILGQLREKVVEMGDCTEKNQTVVEAIVGAMDIYKENMEQVLDDSRGISDLSESMLQSVLS